MALKIHPPLDSGHQPFKRMKTIGPGPSRRPPIEAKLMYDCNKTKKYTQKCVILAGPRQGKSFDVVTDPSTKQDYNAMYNDERKNSAATNNYRAGFVLKKDVKIYEPGKASLRKLNSGGKTRVLQFTTSRPTSRPTAVRSGSAGGRGRGGRRSP